MRATSPLHASVSNSTYGLTTMPHGYASDTFWSEPLPDAPPYRHLVERLLAPLGRQVTRADVLRATWNHHDAARSTCAIARVAKGEAPDGPHGEMEGLIVGKLFGIPEAHLANPLMKIDPTWRGKTFDQRTGTGFNRLSPLGKYTLRAVAPLYGAQECQAKFAFQSVVWREANLLTIELTHVHRQRDDALLRALRHVRTGEAHTPAVRALCHAARRAPAAPAAAPAAANGAPPAAPAEKAAAATPVKAAAPPPEGHRADPGSLTARQPSAAAPPRASPAAS